jgi:hypothetical protein
MGKTLHAVRVLQEPHSSTDFSQNADRDLPEKNWIICSANAGQAVMALPTTKIIAMAFFMLKPLSRAGRQSDLSQCG